MCEFLTSEVQFGLGAGRDGCPLHRANQGTDSKICTESHVEQQNMWKVHSGGRAVSDLMERVRHQRTSDGQRNPCDVLHVQSGLNIRTNCIGAVFYCKLSAQPVTPSDVCTFFCFSDQRSTDSITQIMKRKTASTKLQSFYCC